MAAVVRGVGYRLSIPRYLAAKALGRRLPTLYYGRLSNVGVITLPRRPLPGPDWVRLVPILAGICGSDLGTITGRNSPALSPLVSFPAVLGHEVVARVVEAGPQAGGAAGQRVGVNPFLPCQGRGLEPCPTCQRGGTCMWEK
ncbi:MAG: alcohol dehydrogenase catalytic domain-containing protein, partial [Limnochorda sp.]|uniref:alcohol dehydrogenase catalytic domain-containing protein n=1 Tax=Limnochorda sp. TaxID=1940279 RepID=UPI0039C2826B